MKDYYKTLGIEKGASKDDIKKAFRKLAHEHHPDKTKGDASSAQKFKEASEAYSVLSDDSKRKQYDTFGSAGPGFNPGAGGFNGAQGFGGFDFSQFTQGANGGVEFDLGDIFSEFFGGGRRAKQPKGRDISVDIHTTFEESVFGAEKDIVLTKSASCLTCSGTGAAKGSGVETCKTCNGKGKINETRRSFMGVFSTTRMCDNCHGKGQVPKQKCETCHGEGVTERQQEITLKVPAGIESGEMIRLGGMGEAVSGGTPGDLYVRVHVKPHPVFRKDGHNLVMDMKVKLTDALTGAEKNIVTVDGELEVKIPESTNNGDVLRIKGKGVANERGKRGDLLIRIAIEMPKRLSRSVRQLVEEMKKEGL